MGGHVFEHIPLPAEILHELAGQLHRVPFHAADACDVTFVHLGQHVMQPVPKLMEQRRHVIMRQECRLPDTVDFNAVRKVAHQVRNGGLQHAGVGAQPAVAHVIHPRTAALAGAGGWVEVKLADQRGRSRTAGTRCGALDAVKPNAGVPDGRCVGANRHIKQRFDNLEQARQDLGCREVLLDLLFAESVARFLEFFSGIRQVPIFQCGQAQVRSGKFAQIRQVFDRKRFGLGTQIAQKADDLIRRVGHFWHHRQFSKTGKAQQPGFFKAKLEYLLDQCRVVELECVWRALI